VNRRRHRGDHRLRLVRFCAVLLVVTGASLPAWQWPTPAVDRLSVETPTTTPGSDTPVIPFLFGGDSGPRIPVTAPVSGEVVFSEINPGVAGDEIVLVVRDAHEFWVFLEVKGGVLEFPDGVVPDFLVAGTVLGTARTVSLSVFDRLRSRYVHPRGLFPLSREMPADRLPPLAVAQNGRVIGNGTEPLRPGRFQIIVPAGDLSPALLPERLYLLRDGLLEGDHAFISASDVARLRDDAGNLVVLESELRAGSTVIEVEARRFDGGVEQRRLRLEAVPSPLDTP